MKVNLLGRQSMNFTFGHRYALENRHGFLFYPFGKRAVLNQRPDLREGSLSFVMMMVLVMRMLMVRMRVFMPV